MNICELILRLYLFCKKVLMLFLLRHVSEKLQINSGRACFFFICFYQKAVNYEISDFMSSVDTITKYSATLYARC